MIKLLFLIILFINSLISNPEATNLLWNAIAGYDSRAITEHIDNGANLNSISNTWIIAIHGREYKLKNGTPLHLASVDDPAIVKKLLKHNANPNAKDKNGNTPLHLAAMYGCRKTILYLINAKGDINIKNKFQYTPLSLAILHKHYKAAKILLLHNANPNLTLNSGLDHIMKSLFVGDDSRFIKLLVEFGADINKRYDYEKTILHIASFLNRYKSIKFLLNNCIDINSVDKNGDTALHIAANNNHYKVIQILLSCSSINVDIKNNKDKDALSVACYKNNKEAIEILSKYNALIKILGQRFKKQSIENLPPEIPRHIISYLPKIKRTKLV